MAFSPPAFAPSPFFTMSNIGTGPHTDRPELVTRLVYNALYRYDDELSAVPDLAAEPCTVAADGLTITCTLVQTTFHDGSPLTADDVVFTYELGRADPGCRFVLGEFCEVGLASVTAVDDRTVQFRLIAPNATFLTKILPGVLIDSKAVVEAAYAPLAERAPGLDATDYEAAAEALFTELGSDDPDCAGALGGADALFEAAGLEPLPKDQFMRADATFDACMYAQETATLLADVGRSLRASGLEAIAAAYGALSFNRAPVGTGPFRFVEIQDGTRVILDAFDRYHLGRPATPSIEIRLMRDAAAARDALERREVHWMPIPLLDPEMERELARNERLQIATWPAPVYYMLAYNVRPGMLFSDRNLRSAVELCIDKPSTVDAATEGSGDPIYSHVTPFSWAYAPDLPRPIRDEAAARDLIELSGWTLGDDGVYVRDQERLSADVFVNAAETQRVAFMDLVAEQVRDCGIELNVIPADPDTVLAPLEEYPHIPGGYDEPFEAVFIGWLHGFDPHDELWHSHSVSSPANPHGLNFMGFESNQVDDLLDRGLATYDQRERARIYRELQLVLAEEKPVLFAWSYRAHEALDARIGSTGGDLQLSSREWPWEWEKLILRE
jgi:ABC-type transport system substrate-binding protein